MSGGLAFLLARKGSKGLKSKNRRLLSGRPLIEWTLDYLIQSPQVDRVILSTDDEVILEEYSKGYSEKIIAMKRPSDLSGDFATSDEVLAHCCKELGTETLGQFEYGIYMQITEPFRPKEILEKCVSKYIQTECDSVFAAVEYHKNFWVEKNGGLGRLDDGNRPDAPRQKKKRIIREDTGICLVADLALFAAGRRIGEQPGAVFYEHIGSHVDIHSQDDLDFAESLCRFDKVPQ